MSKEMIIRKITIILVILLFLTSPVFGQEETLSPFVSRINAEVNEMSIVLTWKSPEGIRGKILIYRYTQEITEKNLGLAQLLMIADISNESYVDSPEDTKEYYYAVLIQDTKGVVHKVFAHYRNKTVTGVRIVDVTPEEERATKITNLKAEVSDTSIIITFQSSKPSRPLLLYRSTSRIVDEDSLLQTITPVALKDFSYKYIDYPVSGIQYYYAVLDAGLVKIGTIDIVPGQNSLKSPVMIPVKDDSVLKEPATKRSFPLPYLDLISDIESGKSIISSVSSYLPEQRKISDDTKKAIEKVLSSVKVQQEDIIMEPVILPVDSAGNTGGESSILQKIISEYFSGGLYYKAEQQLRDYLKIKHSEEVEARSYFYLGQILFFKGAYRDALLAFLMSLNLYYVEIQPWMDACFNKLFLSEEE
ncbi:MAG: hypothetical protein JXB88_06125 [Spirochaetales bacterium]|nr:hypothetical protein [Spirochaetales bacterium]